MRKNRHTLHRLITERRNRMALVRMFTALHKYKQDEAHHLRMQTDPAYAERQKRFMSYQCRCIAFPLTEFSD